MVADVGNGGKTGNIEKVGEEVKVYVPPSALSSSSHSSSSSPSAPGDARLYSVKVRLELPPGLMPARGKDQGPKSPFWSNDLLALGSPRWGKETFLAVAQSWDPVYDKKSKRPHGRDAVLIRLLVCASSTGGDGFGGRGGWLPRRYIKNFLGQGKGSAGYPITLSSGGSLMTACREFQAVMSLSELPERMRWCLLNPKVCQESRAAAALLLPRQASSSFSTSSSREVTSASGGGEGGKSNGTNGKGGKCADDDGYTTEAARRPSNVPTKLWESLVESFNRSQVQAIRKVVDGSPSGFTLLQVRSANEVCWLMLLFRRLGCIIDDHSMYLYSSSLLFWPRCRYGR